MSHFTLNRNMCKTKNDRTLLVVTTFRIIPLIILRFLYPGTMNHLRFVMKDRLFCFVLFCKTGKKLL